MRARILLAFGVGSISLTAAFIACVGDSPAVVPPDSGSDAPSDVANCTDAQSDPKNCGTCGHACATGFACVKGVCDNVVIGITAGANHNCAVLKNNQVYCWGANELGQSGADPSASEPPTFVARDKNGSTFLAASAGGGAAHSCALRTDRLVACWGRNGENELGFNGGTFPDGGSSFSSVPLTPVGPQFNKTTTISALARGSSAKHECGLADGGTVVCWGWNQSTQVTALDASTCNTEGCPATIPAILEPASQVTVGGTFSCALDGAGVVRCWGNGADGELGNGNHGKCIGCAGKEWVVPVPVASYIASGRTLNCAIIKSDGSVQCWGTNENGELGHLPLLPDGGAVDPCCSFDCGFSQNHPRCVDHPVVVPGITGAVVLAIADSAVCALKTDGNVWCWGANDKGQLGRGTTSATPSPTPTVIPNFTGVADVVAGAGHFCALKKDSTVWCWGLNDKGQLGSGTGNANAPVEVKTLPR